MNKVFPDARAACADIPSGARLFVGGFGLSGVPEECIFARTTVNVTADLRSRITPCQFGGKPDCSQCGCIASAGLKAVGDYRLFSFVPLRSIFFMSEQVGKHVAKLRSRMPA